MPLHFDIGLAAQNQLRRNSKILKSGLRNLDWNCGWLVFTSIQELPWKNLTVQCELENWQQTRFLTLWSVSENCARVSAILFTSVYCNGPSPKCPVIPLDLSWVWLKRNAAGSPSSIWSHTFMCQWKLPTLQPTSKNLWTPGAIPHVGNISKCKHLSRVPNSLHAAMTYITWNDVPIISPKPLPANKRIRNWINGPLTFYSVLWMKECTPIPLIHHQISDRPSSLAIKYHNGNAHASFQWGVFLGGHICLGWKIHPQIYIDNCSHCQNMMTHQLGSWRGSTILKGSLVGAGLTNLTKQVKAYCKFLSWVTWPC